MYRNRLWATLLCAAAASVAQADAKKEDPLGSSTEPKGVPLELRIVNAAKEAYECHTNGDPSHIFREKIRKAESNGYLLPAARVEMELEFKNTGATSIQIWVDGDATLLALDLKGFGAMTASVKSSPARSAVKPVSVTISPGKTHRIPLTDLACGVRKQETFAYLPEPEQYQLVAKFRTGVFPAPPKTKPLEKGFGEVELKSAPLLFRAVRPS